MERAGSCSTWTSWTGISCRTDRRAAGGAKHPEGDQADAGRPSDDTRPEPFVPIFVEAGADHISVHQEACPHLDRTLRLIQSEGALAGVVLNPSTPITMLEEVLDLADYVLLMSVNPGIGGPAASSRRSLHKVKALAAQESGTGVEIPHRDRRGRNLENLAEVVRAGVDWVVTGAAVFLQPGPGVTVAEMRRIAEEAVALRV